MRRIVIWLSGTALAVALLIGYQVAYAGSGSNEGDKGQACPTTTTASTQDPTATICDPANGDRPGDTNGKPGERK